MIKLVIKYSCWQDACSSDITMPFEYTSISEAYDDIQRAVEHFGATGDCPKWLTISVSDFLESYWNPTSRALEIWRNAGILVLKDQSKKYPGLYYFYQPPEIMTIDDWFQKYCLHKEE